MLGLDELAQMEETSVSLATIIATPGDGTVVASVGGTELTVPHTIHYVPGVNDVAILLQQGNRRYAIGALTNPAAPVTPRSTAPAPSQPKPTKPVPPTPKPTTVVRTFTATSLACFRGGKWRTDTSRPHQGDWGGYGRNTGAWFYGTQVRAALKGAEVIGAKWYCARVDGGQYGSEQPTVYTMPHASKPSGTPTLLGSGSTLAGLPVNTKRWLSFPLALAQQMSDGTANGIAAWINADDPYIVFGSLSDSRSSGALQLTYRKV